MCNWDFDWLWQEYKHLATNTFLYAMLFTLDVEFPVFLFTAKPMNHGDVTLTPKSRRKGLKLLYVAASPTKPKYAILWNVTPKSKTVESKVKWNHLCLKQGNLIWVQRYRFLWWLNQGLNHPPFALVLCDLCLANLGVYCICCPLATLIQKLHQ